MAPSSPLQEDILPEIQKELEDLEDDDFDDEEEIDVSLAGDPDDNVISTLEEHLSQVTVELSAIQNEREKQLLQLDPLTKDYQALVNQKELRIERMKLQEQLDELQSSIDAKLLVQKGTLGQELEQAKSHFRQLQRTLKLVQGSVEQILESSASDTPKGLEARNRATMRQALLKQLLQQDYTSQVSLYSNLDDMHEDDEDDDGDDDGRPQLFHKKNKRYESMESMMSEFDMADTATATVTAAGARRQFPSTTTSSSEGRSLSRSKFYQTHDQQQQQQRHRSIATRMSSSSQGSTGSGGGTAGPPRRKQSKSSSANSSSISSRIGSLRRSKSFDAASNASTTNTPSSSATSRRKTSLMRMLDHDHEQLDGDDGGSHDTPKTTNTQGTR
jgi:hypothetical protein